MTRRPRKRRPARGSRRRSWQNRLWGSVIAGAVVFAVGVVILSQTVFKAEEIDERLCPKGSGPAAGLAILLDLTDSLNAVQLRRLRGVLDRRIDEAKPNTLIAVGAVRVSAAERGADFARCKPMTGEHANEFYQNPRLIEERYRQEFREPFDAILAAMLNKPAAERSPIMESMQALLVSTPGFVDAEYPRRVIIASDLIQNSEAFSFYRGDTWGEFVGSQRALRLAGRLQDVTVEICRIPRPGARVDSRAVGDFWVNYFEQAEAFRVLVGTCPLGDL